MIPPRRLTVEMGAGCRARLEWARDPAGTTVWQARIYGPNGKLRRQFFGDWTAGVLQAQDQELRHLADRARRLGAPAVQP